MQKSLHIDPAKCTGCLQCEMACSYEHTGTINPSKSRIKVFDLHHTGRKVPYTCTQCDEAWCLHACPVEAITVDKATGAKVVNETTCVGCKVCTIACPFGTINYVADTGKVFDESWSSGQPVTFPLDRVIPGWSQGLVGMKEGGRRTLVIPAELAYGANPPPGAGIAPNETLVFVVQLLKLS